MGEYVIMERKKSKIAIIGAGNVGAATAYTIAMQRLVSELVLIDVNREKAEGEVLDGVETEVDETAADARTDTDEGGDHDEPDQPARRGGSWHVAGGWHGIRLSSAAATRHGAASAPTVRRFTVVVVQAVYLLSETNSASVEPGG